jgi:hypothetical protein
MDYTNPTKQVIFLVEGTKIYCDRRVATIRSAMVRGLSADFKEDLEVSVMEGITVDTMCKVIDLLYTGRIVAFLSKVKKEDAKMALDYFLIDLRNGPGYVRYHTSYIIEKHIAEIKEGETPKELTYEEWLDDLINTYYLPK